MRVLDRLRTISLGLAVVFTSAFPAAAIDASNLRGYSISVGDGELGIYVVSPKGAVYVIPLVMHEQDLLGGYQCKSLNSGCGRGANVSFDGSNLRFSTGDYSTSVKVTLKGGKLSCVSPPMNGGSVSCVVRKGNEIVRLRKQYGIKCKREKDCPRA